jgi:hypothetical protein
MDISQSEDLKITDGSGSVKALISSILETPQTLRLEMPSSDDACNADELLAEDSNEQDDGNWNANDDILEVGYDCDDEGECSDDEFPVETDEFSVVQFKLPFAEFAAVVPRTPLSSSEILSIVTYLVDSRIANVPCRFSVNSCPIIDRVILQDNDVVTMVLLLLGGGKPQKKKGKPLPRKVTKRAVVVARASKRVGKVTLPQSGDQRLASEFARALKTPFDPASFGVKCPDTYHFPTVTGHIHYEFQLTSAGGLAQALIYPSPMIATSCYFGTITTSCPQFTQNTSTTYFSTRSNVATNMDMYRVVAFGVKISNLQPELSGTGRLMVTPLPIAGTSVGFDMMNNTAFAGNYITSNYVGLTQAQLSSAAMLQKPSTVEVTIQNLFSESYEWSMVPVHPLFYKFKNPGNQAATALTTMIESGEGVFVNSTGVVVGSGTNEFQDNMSMEGGVALNILGEGLGSGACFQVEVVLHLEGTPAISTAINAISFSGAESFAGSTAAVENALNAASRLPVLRALKTGLDFARGKSAKRVVSGLGDMALKHYAGFGLGDIRTALGRR